MLAAFWATASAARPAVANWEGRAFTTRSGEAVTVYVADGYLDGEAAAQRWAEFFATLVHGPELARLSVYVGPPAVVEQMCESAEVTGCYGSSRIVMPGESVGGILPEEVARHEYGHHIAANRLNIPWKAVDWGTKRWASAAGVCERVRRGTAFAGDEGLNYARNPGEAFAEAYRVLDEVKHGLPSAAWPIVEGSFYPDQRELEAIERDVLQPWTKGTTTVRRLGFAPVAKRVHTLPLATALDGDLAVTVTVPLGGLYDVTLLAPDGRRVLARGLWSGRTQLRLTHTICGERKLYLRVLRRGPAGTVVVRTTTP